MKSTIIELALIAGGIYVAVKVAGTLNFSGHAPGPQPQPTGMGYVPPQGAPVPTGTVRCGDGSTWVQQSNGTWTSRPYCPPGQPCPQFIRSAPQPPCVGNRQLFGIGCPAYECVRGKSPVMGSDGCPHCV